MCQYPRCAAERPTALNAAAFESCPKHSTGQSPNLRADTRAKVAASSKGASLKWAVLTQTEAHVVAHG